MSPIRSARSVLLVAMAMAAAAQNQSVPTLRATDSMQYPPLSRQARIEGQVHLEFFVNHNGDVVAVNVLSGHPMLAPAAADNVRSWKFLIPKNAPLDDQRYETTFDFGFATEPMDLPLNSNALVVVDSFRHVSVTAGPAMVDGGDPRRADCPSEKEKIPPTPSPRDFVEMSRSCSGQCPVYTVRIHANGLVDWVGMSYVHGKGKESSNIGSSLAQDVIARFSTGDFWALCAVYTQSSAVSKTTTFRVRIGNREKTVSNGGNSAPQWVDELEYAIDDAADTHQWLHGDPRQESLSHIEDDSYGPKPGVTPLMRAAARGENEKVKSLLKEGADVDQVDASGWTALMYAKDRSCDGGCIESDTLPTLLVAGASPTYSSPRGDTALMSAAYDGRFAAILVKVGASVNAQNADGVSTLMILASLGRADEIKQALRSGADPKLKDAQGRTALDYLRLANCGKSPLQDEDLTETDSRDCKQLDEDDVRKSERLLREKPTR